MALNKVKGLLSSAMAVATVLSTIPAVNVSAAEAPAPAIDIVSQYELDLLKYGPDYLRCIAPGYENLSPAQLEEAMVFIDGNYTQYDSVSQITYGADGSVLSSIEYEYSPATGLVSKITSINPDFSSVTVNEYDSNGKKVKNINYSIDGRYLGYGTWQYDNRGNNSRIDSYDANGLMGNYTDYNYQYWDNGNQKEYWSRNYTLINGEWTVTYATHSESDESGSPTLFVNYSYDWANHILLETERFEYIYTENEWGYKTQERGNHYTEGVYDYYMTSASNFTDNSTLENITYYWNPDTSPRGVYKMVFRKLDDSTTYYSTDTMEYDAAGNVTSHSVSERDTSDPNIVLKQTNYDGNGNIKSWTDYRYVESEYFDNGHYVPDFDAYSAPEGCVFNYRLYNPNSGEHFYTGSREEALHITELGWNFEGPGFVNPTAGDAVYRLYNSEHGDHIYTKDKDEINSLLKEGWAFDGDAEWTPAFPSATEENGQPMYRLHNTNAWNNDEAGAWHFTMSEDEKNNLLKLDGWVYEGIAWYSV